MVIGFLCSCLSGLATVQALESDNFRLPLDTDMADVGEFLEAVHTLMLQESVNGVNKEIERALTIRESGRRDQRLARWHDPDALAEALKEQFPAPIAETALVRKALKGTWAQRTYPGQKLVYSSIWLNFSAHSLLDPRKYFMLAQCGTVKAYGVYFGTDKLTHFHQLGWTYYKMYRSLLAKGMSPEDAYHKTLKHHITGGVWGEANLFGTLSTGIYSNADMAANHVGFRFFQNLTETVLLKGVECQPLVVRCGVFYRLNDHVRIRSGWFKAYVSDHWNEGLNPSLYDWTMRAGLRGALQGQAESVVQFYTQKDGRPNDPAYYDNLARELSTYYGEDYGHSGEFDKLLTIGNTCFPALHAREKASPRPSQ